MTTNFIDTMKRIKNERGGQDCMQERKNVHRKMNSIWRIQNVSFK